MIAFLAMDASLQNLHTASLAIGFTRAFRVVRYTLFYCKYCLGLLRQTTMHCLLARSHAPQAEKWFHPYHTQGSVQENSLFRKKNLSFLHPSRQNRRLYTHHWMIPFKVYSMAMALNQTKGPPYKWVTFSASCICLWIFCGHVDHKYSQLSDTSSFLFCHLGAECVFVYIRCGRAVKMPCCRLWWWW